MKPLLMSFIGGELEYLLIEILDKSVDEFIRSGEFQSNDICIFKEVLKEMMLEPATEVVGNFIDKDLSEDEAKQYYMILLSLLTDLDSNVLSHDQIIPLVPQGEEVFIKNLILEHKLTDAFIYFFTSTVIDFKEE